MMTLEDFAPTQHESEVIHGLRLPTQVGIGYLRAWRKANGGKRSDGRPLLFDRDHAPDVGNFWKLFGNG